MKLSVSNIAWAKENDEMVYDLMKKLGYQGLEIAPTRIFPENPYSHCDDMPLFTNRLRKEYQIEICSMQSILYGKKENIFSSQKELESIEEYTKKAILFAQAASCGNLVFGCPKNRNNINDSPTIIAEEYFLRMGQFAQQHGTCFSLEPNPEIYGTNYLTKTQEVFDLVRELNCPGLGVNVDLGTMIQNKEKLDVLDFKYINHIHISEPFLKKIEVNRIHKELIECARENKYSKYISIEMGNLESIEEVEEVLENISSIFYKR